ncbi:MAG: MBL fold metallo-hydrolase [Myxococcales bacterium]|jgi:ribonuclease J|nr:MBL fold metallo-hydrolase [Myxococcales bacterium]
MNPRLIVHRSAHQIGGNCIEIAFQGHRLILDAGSPLDASSEDAASPPPTLDTSTPVDGVIVSHPHQDHYGLLRGLPGSWPVWCGGPTEKLVRLTVALTGGSLPQEVHTFDSFTPFRVGPFKVTPLLTDHSAFDAHMLLVEVGGRRLLYSGDFRRTGRKAKLVDRMIKAPPKDIDVLLLEGTTLGRADPFPTERALEERFKTVFQQTAGRVFVSWSAQNIDRTVTIYRACKQTRRTLLVDLYTVDVLEQLGAYCKSLPQMGWPNLRGVVTAGIKRLYETPDRLNRPEFFERCCRSRHAFSAEKIESGPRNNVVMLRPSLLRDYVRKGLTLTKDDCWIFSMWSGYLNEGGYKAINEAFDSAGARFEQIHTSGHASRADLQAFASSINAKHLVPIHSFDWDQHTDGFENVTRLDDGAVFEILS